MPPISPTAATKQWVKDAMHNSALIMFSKSFCPFCNEVKEIFKQHNFKYAVIELDIEKKGAEMQTAMAELSNQKTVPNVFVRGQHIGGCDKIKTLNSEGKLKPLVTEIAAPYDYDLVVIGGGSGGLAASKAAAKFGAKVAVFDYVEETPRGTRWGLGGTCVNVGCIPKKLMHQAAIHAHNLSDARSFGWQIPEKDDGSGNVSIAVKHDWQRMVEEIQNHIKSTNFGARVELRQSDVTYINARAKIDAAASAVNQPEGDGAAKIIEYEDAATKTKKTLTARHVLLATGERPRYPPWLLASGSVATQQQQQQQTEANTNETALKCVISSDDLFSLPYSPGRTLVIGASYVALECAGFLAGLGYDVTCMVRSILLRGFDQECAEMIGAYMGNHGVRFVRPCVPTKIVELEAGQPGRIQVTGKYLEAGDTQQQFQEEFNTVLVAIGRDPCTSGLGLEQLGVNMDKSRKLVVDEAEQTNVHNVFALGDIVSGAQCLTPVAIEAGRNLAARLYGGAKRLTSYHTVPTTVFTPLEYGCIGWSEEDAKAKFGEQNVIVYNQYFKPLEWTLPHREDNVCFAKLVCKPFEATPLDSAAHAAASPASADLSSSSSSNAEITAKKAQFLPSNLQVIGFHVLGPNAGEITQGFAVAMRMNASKADFDATIGIHPTEAEVFTLMQVYKGSGLDASVAGC